jgi:Holliday junction resolvasome RuvABC DNA-binding subunit
VLEGPRTQLVVRRPNEPGHALASAITRTQSCDALVGLGWKPVIARAAVDDAIVHVGAEAPLEVVIKEALRRCPRPAA